jgi:hypothetical protein
MIYTKIFGAVKSIVPKISKTELIVLRSGGVSIVERLIMKDARHADRVKFAGLSFGGLIKIESVTNVTVPDNKMSYTLESRALMRKQCAEKHMAWLRTTIRGGEKGLMKRKMFCCFVLANGKGIPFADEDAEYEAIGKFGRRAWNSKEVIDCFAESDREIVMEICKDFGAFDY